MEETELLIITEEEAGQRLDKILAARYPEKYSRSYFQYLLEEQRVLLNQEPVKKRTQPKAGDEVEVAFILTPELDLLPENIPLEILYEDDHLIAINKPAGMVVHPAAGNWTGTFVNALLYHCSLDIKDDTLRPGIVHRLDKDTTGVLLAAKTVNAQQHLMAQFAARKVRKEYLALCIGNPGKGKLVLPIGRHPVKRKQMAVALEGGRPAVTHYAVSALDAKLSLVEILLETGRTHQIRVHMQHHGTPVLGDPLYGSDSVNRKYGTERQMLHAHRLCFTHPVTGKEVSLEAPLPAEMQAFISKMQKI